MAEGRLLDAQAERALALAMTGDVAGARREIDAVVKDRGGSSRRLRACTRADAVGS
jgi:hypothetical protein